LMRENAEMEAAIAKLRADSEALAKENEALQFQLGMVKRKLIGTVKLTIFEAKELLDKHIIASTDPFCTVVFDEQEHRTATVFKSRTPTWNQEFLLYVTDANSVITIRVWDHAKIGSPHSLGEFFIPVSALKDTETVSNWYCLQPIPPSTKSGGSVRIAARYSRSG